MKEAAGEANLTVIAVILIGVVMAVALPLIQGMMQNTAERACCTNSGGTWGASGCEGGQSTWNGKTCSN